MKKMTSLIKLDKMKYSDMMVVRDNEIKSDNWIRDSSRKMGLKNRKKNKTAYDSIKRDQQ